MTELSPESGARPGLVALYPLTFVDEGGQVVIGRPEIDSFAVFPSDAAAVVRRIQAGDDLATVAAWYQATYGEPADLGDFVQTLSELHFVRPAGQDDDRPTAVPPLRWQRLGTVLFSAPALGLYALAAAMAVYLMWRVPSLRPTPSTVFFSRSLLVISFATLMAQLVGIALHESFHVLAGRRVGLASSLSVGRRLYFVVFQTTLAGVLGLPARKRILPFCAGLIADALLVSALTGTAEVARLAGWPVWLARVAVGLAYVTVLRMLWQAMIFMETDLCHVLASALRCPDLHGMTRTYLRHRWARLRQRPGEMAEQAGWTGRDLRIVRRYAPFVVVGSAVMIGFGAVTTVPVMAGFATRVYQGVADGTVGSARFWDSALTGIAIVAQFAIIGVLALVDRARSRAAARAIT
jgi:hypothetical protein